MIDARHLDGLAREVVGAYTEAGLTIACAESLTAGMVSATLAQVPGASAVLRGGVTAYATDVKHSVLGVDAELLAREGAVDADVARLMAKGVAELMEADVGVSTTGVAGPAEQDGQAVGTIFVGCWRVKDHAGRVRGLRLGDCGRDELRRQATAEALEALLDAVERPWSSGS